MFFNNVSALIMYHIVSIWSVKVKQSSIVRPNNITFCDSLILMLFIFSMTGKVSNFEENLRNRSNSSSYIIKFLVVM